MDAIDEIVLMSLGTLLLKRYDKTFYSNKGRSSFCNKMSGFRGVSKLILVDFHSSIPQMNQLHLIELVERIAPNKYIKVFLNTHIYYPIVHCYGDESCVITPIDMKYNNRICKLGGIMPVENISEFLLLLYLESTLSKSISKGISSNLISHQSIWLLMKRQSMLTTY